MSRYYNDDGYDENFPNEAALWRANADRALKGKRGRKALAELREALLALPSPRLIAGALCTVDAAKRTEGIPSQWQQQEFAEIAEEEGEGVCAIGAYLWHRKVKAGMDPQEAFDSLPLIFGSDTGAVDTAQLAKEEAGMAFPLAWDIACENDETFGQKTPEERHAAFIAWIDRELAS